MQNLALVCAAYPRENPSETKEKKQHIALPRIKIHELLTIQYCCKMSQALRQDDGINFIVAWRQQPSLVYPGIVKFHELQPFTALHITACELGAGIMSRAESPCINPYKVLLKLDMLSLGKEVSQKLVNHKSFFDCHSRRQPKQTATKTAGCRCWK